MKLIQNCAIVVMLATGINTVFADEVDSGDKDNNASANKSSLQQTAEDIAAIAGKGINNAVEGVKQMPDAISKAAKKIKDDLDEK